MANPFQDQFLKAGLVDKNKVNKVKRSKHKNTKQKGKDNEADQSKQLAQRAIQEKAQSDRELNRQKEELALQKAIAAQIKQLIEMNKLDEQDGEIDYRFSDGNTIKTLQVTDHVQKQLSDGRLAIVRLDTQYAIVPRPVAEKIRLRDESYVLLCNDTAENAAHDEDDPYAKYKIPDDLMW